MIDKVKFGFKVEKLNALCAKKPKELCQKLPAMEIAEMREMLRKDEIATHEYC